MADKQLARNEVSDRGIFSDDDPLSELARIVGYDNRPAVQQLQEIERARESVRYDPSLDLEAELTREFAAYDAPAVDPEPVAAMAEVAPELAQNHAEADEYRRPAVAHFDAAALQDGARYDEEMARAASDAAPSIDASPFDELDLERELEMSLALDIAPEPTVLPAADVFVPPQASAPVAAAGVPVTSDDLLADVERFPVVPAPEAARKNTYPFTPSFSRATPVASAGGAATQRAFARPLPAVEPVPAPVMAAVAPVLAEPEPLVVAGAPSLTSAVNEPEPDFDLDNFELDLSDIELDLSEPMLAEEPQATPVVAFTPSFNTLSAEVPKPGRFDPPAPRAEAPSMPFVGASDESELPFDPSMISETEETVTAVHDLHVPHLPVVEQEKPTAFQPDFDLDLDAEMAQLFGAQDRVPQPVPDVSGKARGDVFVSQLGAAPLPAKGVADDFDEFQRAMEEDFRQSLNQRREADTSADGAEGYTNDYNLDNAERPGMRRWALLAATVAGIAILGGGVYAFMGANGGITASGEPKIILADKTPVKMVPADKGGKTVPNQDKAVYDRVAGAQDQTPQQSALVTSKEDPVDVVQRTLTPETLPLEGRSDADADITPVDDEGTDRLLPDTAAQSDNDASVGGDNPAPAVSPRKVRTMIVRPDGTLVAREETAIAPLTTASAAATPSSAIQGTTTPATMTPPDQPVSLETLSAASAQPADSMQPAATAAIPAATEQVAPVVDTSASDGPAATVIPQARPARTSAPVQTAAAAPPQQPAAKPVSDSALSAAADAVPATPAVAGGYVVQVASLPSEAEAQTSYNRLTGKFAFLGGRGVDIRKADIAGKGTYYRVRIPAGSRDDANALCSRYKSAGGSCLVTK